MSDDKDSKSIVEAGDLRSQVGQKLVTLEEIVSHVMNSGDDVDLTDSILRFKLMLVKKSMNDICTMMRASDLVKDALFRKIEDEVIIYPIPTLLDILKAMNSMLDRNISLMESVLPKTESLENFLANSRKNVTMIQNVNIPSNLTPEDTEKLTQIVEYVVSQISTLENKDDTKE